jgi:hypothetical protein
MLDPLRLFSTRLKDVPPMERPLAMATRLLETCANDGSVRFTCLVRASECLLRFRHLAHLWVKLPVTTEDAQTAYGRRPHLNVWLSAANGMRPALMDLASRKKDHHLKASELATLAEGREDLEPFATWLRDDQQVQARVADAWNSVVQAGRHLSLPDVFSVQLVNPPEVDSSDHWISHAQHDYGTL